MKTMRMIASGVLMAGALAAGGGVASAATPSALAPTGVSAAASCWTDRAGLGFIGGTVYAHKSGGCSDRPSTVTVVLLRDGIVAARMTCRAEAGRSCFAATPRVFMQPGVNYEAR